jgi:PAS domain S-box-containing protein
MVNEEFREIANFSIDIIADSPVNPSQALKESVDQEGFAYLKKNPDKVFRKMFEHQGRFVVNIYTPDKATAEGCVSCHVSIKNKQYNIGDILGIRKYSLIYSEDVALGKVELNADLKEFIKKKNLFTATLTALRSGGSISLDSESRQTKTVRPVKNKAFQEQLREVQTQFATFVSLTETLVGLEVSSMEFRRANQDILRLSTLLTMKSDDLTNKFIEITDQNQRQIKRTVIASAGLTLLLFSGLYYYLNRFVLSPVIVVSNALTRLAKGDLDEELAVQKSQDEIGNLCTSSNLLINQLKMFIESTKRILIGKPHKEEFKLSGDFHSAFIDITNQVQEKEKAKKELLDAHGQLELKVQERTAELINSNSTMVSEINKRQEMENSLKETNEFLKNILDSPHNISIISTDLEKNIIYWNKGAESLLGYKAEEVVGKKPIEILYPGDEGANRTLSETVEKVVKEKRGKSIEIEELTKYKDKIWVRMTISPRLNDKGEVLGVLGIGENISQQKFAEMELRENEERFRMILDTAYNAFVSLNEKGEVIEWNTQAERVFGWKKQEMVNQIFFGLIIPEDLHEAHENGLWRYLEKGKQKIQNQRLELTAINRQGKSFPVEITITPLKYKGGVIFNVFIEDISERKLMETQLHHAQKMESIGQLAAGIAHEINTPLQYIGDNTRFLQDSFLEMIDIVKKYRDRNEIGEMVSDPQGDKKPLVEPEDLDFLVNEIPAAIQQSLDGIGRVTKIVQAMKEFSHPGSDDKKMININKAIETTLDVSRNVWKYTADIETNFDPELPLVPCFPDELNQVFLNLIVNAAHAIEEKNTNSESQKGTIMVTTKKNNNWVEICIKDTGKGIPKEHNSRIFDPFFTTKEVGKGTGQGLSIVHSVITKKHKGEVSFESKVNEGTSFLVRLPL